MSETVALDVELRSPIERVWQALTDPATLSQWTFFDCEDFQPVAGHTFQFRGKAATGWTVSISCEVLEAEAPHRLSYTWAVESHQHQTTVTWTLTAAEGGVTRLHLEQSGFAPEAKQEIGGARYGWTQMLQQLQSRLAAA